jgi:long-chain acyl-CoA synthetase
LIEGKPAFFVTARIKEIIIRGGEKYSPLAIEKKIFSLMPELRGNLVVVGFSHLLYGEEVGAYLQTESLSGALRERLGSSLEKIAQDLRPKVVICSAEPIPRTHTGKIQRRKLQPLFSAFKDCKGASKIVTK